MSADAVPFLEVSFPTSPPTVLDVAGENIPLAGYFVGAFSVVSSLETLIGFPVPRLLLAVWPVVPQAMLFRVTRPVVVFSQSFLVVI